MKDVLEVADYWQNVVTLNNWHQHRISRLIVQKLFGTVTGKRLALFGFAFKANTNDTREAPAIRIAKSLIEENSGTAVSSVSKKLNYLITKQMVNFTKRLNYLKW